MNSKKRRLARCRLYLILDTSVCPYEKLFESLQKAVLCGVDIVQLRDKLFSCRDAQAFARKAMYWLKGRIPFIVNDRVDLAKMCGADGVHLGQEDLPPSFARKMLGPKAIVGVSCQNLGHLHQACRDGADYVGFGSVFKTLTKPERSAMDLGLLFDAVKYARDKGLPLFAIGGITKADVGLLAGQGVDRIAVCRDILLAKDMHGTVNALKNGLKA